MRFCNEVWFYTLRNNPFVCFRSKRRTHTDYRYIKMLSVVPERCQVAVCYMDTMLLSHETSAKFENMLENV